jgi:hypothetical protein
MKAKAQGEARSITTGPFKQRLEKIHQLRVAIRNIEDQLEMARTERSRLQSEIGDLDAAASALFATGMSR